jgi:membrane-bound serine protease (ClpP class)
MIQHGTSRERRLARRHCCFAALAAVAAALLWSSLPGPLALAQQQAQGAAQTGPDDGQRRSGRLLHVTAPISTAVTNRVIRMAKTVISDAKQRGEWPIIIFELQPGRCDFGAALDLATKITALDGATTVAYVPNDDRGRPQTLRGHAVLVAMACDRIAMAKESRIGEAGAFDEHISPHVRSAYAEIAESRRTVPIDLTLGMLDPALEVFEVQTSDVTREFVRSDRLEALRKQKTIKVIEPPVIPAGTAGLFTGEDGRKLGFVRHTVDNRHALARALGLPPDAVEEDPSLDGGWRAMAFRISGPLTDATLERVQHKIMQQIDKLQINLLVLVLDSPGGAPQASLAFANYLSGFAPGERRTVAFIPTEASGDAAIIALACDHIVMQPEAVLGGGGSIDDGPQLTATLKTLEQILADRGRSTSLPLAFFDRDLTVYRYVRKSDGMVAYFSEAEAKTQPNPDDWQQGESISQPGKPMRLTGSTAHQYGLALEVVEKYEELKSLYNLKEAPEQLEPDWVDTLVHALTMGPVLFALLLIGGVAFYAETHTPGHGIGGFIATICFVLYFWGNYLGGTADWLEILLFAVGLIFLLLEIFILPGFGIFGVGGVILIVVSLLMAMQTFRGLPHTSSDMRELRDSLLVVTSALLGGIAACAVLRKYLPESKTFQELMATPPAADAKSDAHPFGGNRFERLLGAQGTATTALMPCGKAIIGEELVDCLTEGESIPRGAKVIVTKVVGHRIVVRQA